MPYDGKVRAVDAGPVGVLRLTKRDIQDRRAAVQPPSATGGAPRRTPGNVMAGANGEEPARLTEPLAGTAAPPATRMTDQQQMRYQRPAELQPVLPHLRAKGLHDIEKYSAANPEMVRITADFVRTKMDEGFDFDPAGIYEGNPELFAQDLLARFQQAFEPAPEPLPLYDYIHQTRDGRTIYRWLRNLRQLNVAHPGGLPGGE